MAGVLHKLYLKSPGPVQDLAVSLYGAKLYFREYGSEFRKLLGEFEAHAQYSATELEAYQSERIQKLIQHCYEHVPYYRRVMEERKLVPNDFRKAADLEKLPILTRQTMAENSEDLIARNYKKSKLIVGYTSGTTANPIRIVWDKRVCLIKTVVDWRQKRQGGIEPFDRIAYFIGRQIVPATVKRPPYWRHNWVLNHLFFSAFHLAHKNMDCYLEKLAKFNPRALEGFPSTLSFLATYLNRSGRTFPVKAVFTSAEPLLPSQREAIEKAFCCKVFDFLGMSERVIFATECARHEGKHLDTDFGYTEIIGDEDAPHSKGFGRIVATGLHNYAQPLIRYKTSDVSSMYEEPCSCCRPFPRIHDVTTRDEDIVTTPDGRYLSPSALGTATKDLVSVEHLQIVQEDLHNVVLRLVPRPDFRPEELISVRKSLQNILGDQVKIRIETVDNISRTSSGKFRWVISNVPLKF